MESMDYMESMFPKESKKPMESMNAWVGVGDKIFGYRKQFIKFVEGRSIC